MVSGENHEGRNVDMVIERGLRSSIVLPTLTCASETQASSEFPQARMRAKKRSHLSRACPWHNKLGWC